MPPKKRKVEDVPAYLTELISKAKLVIMNYIFMTSRGVPCTFDSLKNIIAGSGLVLIEEDIALMSLISDNWIRLEYKDKSSFVSKDLADSIDLFNVDKDLNRNEDEVLSEDTLTVVISLKQKQKKPKNQLKIADIQKLTKESVEFFEKTLKNYVAKFNGEINIELLRTEASVFIPRRRETEPSESSVTEPENQIPAADIMESIKKEKFYYNQIASRKEFPCRSAKFETLQSSLDAKLKEGLKHAFNISIENLYVHQTKAIDAIVLKQKSVIVSTSTSSGKSLIFTVPVINEILKNGLDTTAIFMYPTKALAQDQAQKLRRYMASCGLPEIRVEVFDGDTLFESRNEIRSNAKIILTNPDMLHVSILPDHYKWRELLENLKFVVLDEVHIYNGTFGCNVAMIIRRLKRIVNIYKNKNMIFICCSATIANPFSHAQNLLGLEESEIVLITEDGSPSGSKEIVLWNPVEGSLQETAKVFIHFIKNKLKTVLFCKYRKICEMAFKEVQSMIESDNSLRWLQNKVRSYRGGFKAEKRREIESLLFNNQLFGVIATNALELGIDIGELEATLHLGFPFSKSSFWQQAGRAGRRLNHSITLWISEDNTMDKYVLLNPDYLYNRSFESATCSHETSPIMELHLQAAAAEKMIDVVEDKKWFGNKLEDKCRKYLQHMGDNCYFTKPEYLPKPSANIPIRAIAQETIQVLDNYGNLIEEMELSRALFTVYEGAVYLNEGISYIVVDVDWKRNFTATVRRKKVDYLTRQRDFTDVDPVEQMGIRSLCLNHSPETLQVKSGTIAITGHIYGYIKYNPKTKQVLDSVDVLSEPVVKNSFGVWVGLPISWTEEFSRKNLDYTAAIHSLNHLLLTVCPTVALISHEIGTEHYNDNQKRERPRQLILFDISGNATDSIVTLYEKFEMILDSAAKTIFECKCSDGCPCCIVHPGCNEYNDYLCKKSCINLISAILKVEGTFRESQSI